MSCKSLVVVAAMSLLLSGPWSDAIAQRGGGGSGRGGGEGGGGSGNRSGGNSNSNSSSSRSFRGNSGSQSGASSSNRSQPQQRQSFYRGSDSERSSSRSRPTQPSVNRNDSGNDRSDRSTSRLENSDRDGRNRESDSDRGRNQLSNGRDGDRDSRDRDFSDGGRRDYSGYDRNDLPFRSGWWNSYGLAGYPIYSPWRYSRWNNQPYYWWGASSPRGLTSWLVYGFSQPAYWNYGQGRNIWYANDYVYYDGVQTMPADRYYTYLDGLASDIPEISESEAEKMDWKPLGVFAVRRENENESDLTLQLAVNRDGVIAGTYFDQSKKEARPLSGRVDAHSQRATWKFADTDKKDNDKDNDIVFETSIYNLTKPTTSLMVHFGPKASDAEIWQLVRLEQPETTADSAEAAAR